MTNPLSRRKAIGGIAAAAGVTLVAGKVNGSQVVQQTSGQVTSIHVGNGSLSFRVGRAHFYTEKDELLNFALISAFSNGLKVRVGSTSRDIKEFFDGTGKKAGESRKATSVLMDK